MPEPNETSVTRDMNIETFAEPGESETAKRSVEPSLSEFRQAMSFMQRNGATYLAGLELGDESNKKQESSPEQSKPKEAALPDSKDEQTRQYNQYKEALKTPDKDRTDAQRELIEKVKRGELKGDQFIVNPIDPNAGPEEKVEQLRRLSAENKERVRRAAENIQEKFGSDIPGLSTWGEKAPKDIKLKSEREEIREKKPWFDVEHIRDYLRFRAVIENLNDLPKIMEELKAQGFEIIKPDPAKLSSPRDLRLRMAPFDLKAPNGQIIEFYAIPREQYQVMAGGHHEIYKKWRERKIEEMSESEKVERNKDFAKARQMADDAWDAYLKRTNQTQEQVDAIVRKLEAMSGPKASEKTGTSDLAKELYEKLPERLKREATDKYSQDVKDVLSEVLENNRNKWSAEKVKATEKLIADYESGDRAAIKNVAELLAEGKKAPNTRSEAAASQREQVSVPERFNTPELQADQNKVEQRAIETLTCSDGVKFIESIPIGKLTVASLEEKMKDIDKEIKRVKESGLHEYAAELEKMKREYESKASPAEKEAYCREIVEKAKEAHESCRGGKGGKFSLAGKAGTAVALLMVAGWVLDVGAPQTFARPSGPRVLPGKK